MANVQLAKNLKTLRKKYNYTQKDLSAILNITRQAYSHYEKALREPDLCTLVRFSHFYKVTLDDLVAGIIHVDQINESLPIYNYHLVPADLQLPPGRDRRSQAFDLSDRSGAGIDRKVPKL